MDLAPRRRPAPRHRGLIAHQPQRLNLKGRVQEPKNPSGPLGERDVVGTEINHIPPESVTGFG